MPYKAASTWIGASALLSALDIWSTNSPAPAVAEAPEALDRTSEIETPEARTADARTADARTPDARTPEAGTPEAEIPEAKISEQAAPATPTQPAAADISSRGTDEKRTPEISANRASSIRPRSWPPRKLSIALQGGGSFGAFTWGVLGRLLEESDCEFDAISGASVGAVNAALLACGLIVDGREGARKLLGRFWNRVTKEASFRSLMLIGGFSPAGSSVAFGQTLQSGRFDPFDLDPLRRALQKEIDFSALRASVCPKLLVAATRIRDGHQQIFRNADITADTLLASTCPPLVHCAVEIDGESYWDGGYGGNPPVV